ncbi:TPP-dependent acetoin dehydrogenase complex, E3 component, dihydrolipoamide dehydrogenase [Peptoniphilus sp. ING2-D1G]|nr:TPP-dependent acetoin dehydrogenase complex, E3 component, dihydrolipoamide dehydrogenase [Peptoniphilus sp. ING2-D1G]
MKIVIIGGGPAGYVAAIRAAQLGAEVSLIEKDKLGGTCLNRGCVPTKFLLRTAEEFDNANENFEQMGIKVSDVKLDWGKVQERKEAAVKQLVSGVDFLLKSNKVEKIYGKAKFKSKNEILVEGKDGEIIVYFDYAIIATGSKTSLINIEGANLPGVITSDEVLSLEQVPKSMVIIGGGFIGTEIASIYSRLGCKITIVEMLPNIIANMDKDIVEPLKEEMGQKGVDIFVNTKVQSIAKSGETLQVNIKNENQEDMVISAEKVLMAVGRKPVVEDLNLDELNIKVERGRIIVDEKYRTNVETIYAVGDCIGKTMLAHVASAQGIAAVENIIKNKSEIDFRTITHCVYTKPELASVGLTEAQAKEQGYNILVGTAPMYVNSKALIESQTEGLCKYIADKATGEILGLHIAGPQATEFIVEGALAIRLEATVDEIISTIHAHPTVSEILSEAASAIYGESINMPKA